MTRSIPILEMTLWTAELEMTCWILIITRPRESWSMCSVHFSIAFTISHNENNSGGPGNDTIDPDLGNDLVDGGTGNDLLVIDYSTSAGALVNAFSSFVDGLTNSVGFANIEQFDITGTAQADN